MRRGDVIRVSTNAELLNYVFGTHYKAWMKSVYDYGSSWVWMIHLDGVVRNGWRNLKYSDCIKEENLSKNTYGLRTNVGPLKRIVFSKHSGYFVFEGVYEYDRQRSNIHSTRYYNLIEEEFRCRYYI